MHFLKFKYIQFLKQPKYRTKLDGHAAWILHKQCIFGEKIHYNSICIHYFPYGIAFCWCCLQAKSSLAARSGYCVHAVFKWSTKCLTLQTVPQIID